MRDRKKIMAIYSHAMLARDLQARHSTTSPSTVCDPCLFTRTFCMTRHIYTHMPPSRLRFQRKKDISDRHYVHTCFGRFPHAFITSCKSLTLLTRLTLPPKRGVSLTFTKGCWWYWGVATFTKVPVGRAAGSGVSRLIPEIDCCTTCSTHAGWCSICLFLIS